MRASSSFFPSSPAAQSFFTSELKPPLARRTDLLEQSAIDDADGDYGSRNDRRARLSADVSRKYSINVSSVKFPPASCIPAS